MMTMEQEKASRVSYEIKSLKQCKAKQESIEYKAVSRTRLSNQLSHDSTLRQNPFGLRFRVSIGGGDCGSGGGVGDRPLSRFMTLNRCTESLHQVWLLRIFMTKRRTIIPTNVCSVCVWELFVGILEWISSRYNLPSV